MKKEKSFWEFYKYYLQEHSSIENRILHFIGATLCIAGLVFSFVFKLWFLIPVVIFIGYLLPHIGHRHYQGNKSLRKSNPVYCVLGATVLYGKNWLNLITKGKF